MTFDKSFGIFLILYDIMKHVIIPFLIFGYEVS